VAHEQQSLVLEGGKRLLFVVVKRLLVDPSPRREAATQTVKSVLDALWVDDGLAIGQQVASLAPDRLEDVYGQPLVRAELSGESTHALGGLGGHLLESLPILGRRTHPLVGSIEETSGYTLGRSSVTQDGP
jgi:hypothetical protein